MNHDPYNGWYNYETWLCALWLQNDQNSCEYWDEVTNEVADIEDLSNYIKEQVEECNPVTEESGLYADLMNAAIAEVNYYEIAKHFWEDYRIDDET